MKQNKVFTYGKHALEEALTHAPRAVTKVYIDHKVADRKLVGRIDSLQIPTAKLSEGMARSDMRSGTPHQGVIGAISVPQLMQREDKFLEWIKPTPETVLVLLQGVEDPHNTGAIIRSAAGFGATAVLMPEHGQSPVTGAVIKVSAGMAFRLPLIQIQSVEQTISKLKKLGFKVYALSGDGKAPIDAEAFEAPSVFVLGNEGSGVSKQTRSLADKTLTIPMSRRAESLNVAAAAAVALYAWSAKHPQALS